jgi:hypothetical protein
MATYTYIAYDSYECWLESSTRISLKGLRKKHEKHRCRQSIRLPGLEPKTSLYQIPVRTSVALNCTTTFDYFHSFTHSFNHSTTFKRKSNEFWLCDAVSSDEILLAPCLAYSFPLKMEAVSSSEVCGLHLTTRRHIPEHGTFHNHCCENLKLLSFWCPVWLNFC